ncbi:MAG: rod shape-determining protein [Armatimonadota bacterium]
MAFKTLHRIWHPDIAIDLGTSTTRVAVVHRGYRFSAPSGSGEVPALAKGVIVNVDAATEALRPALHHLRCWGVPHPRALACAPTDASDAERDAIRETCYGAGATAVILMPEPLAAALGDGVDYGSQLPTLVMDIGEGVTDCAVIRQGRLAGTFASRVACADLHAAVRHAVYRFASVTITARQAMGLVHAVGAAPPSLDPDGLPLLRFVTVPDRHLSEEVRIPVGVLEQAMEGVLERIIEAMHSLLIENTFLRNELQSLGSGILLSGGGALIPGFASRISQSVGLPVKVVKHPLDGVVLGARRVLPIADQYDLWKRAVQSTRF